MTERDLRSHVVQPFNLTKKKSENCRGEQQLLPVLTKSGLDKQITPKDISSSQEMPPQAGEGKGIAEFQLWATITQACYGCRKTYFKPSSRHLRC